MLHMNIDCTDSDDILSSCTKTDQDISSCHHVAGVTCLGLLHNITEYV